METENISEPSEQEPLEYDSPHIIIYGTIEELTEGTVRTGHGDSANDSLP